MTNKTRAEICYDRLKNRPDGGDWLKMMEQALNEAEARGRDAGLREAVEALATVSVSSASNPWNVHEMCFRKLRELKENVPLGQVSGKGA